MFAVCTAPALLQIKNVCDPLPGQGWFNAIL